MRTERINAFSDGVIAILITILVLELKVPHSADLAALHDLLPVFLAYVLSFVVIAIYWNNHHHMLYLTDRITGGILWANLHLLFWLSLLPFVTGWMGENHFTPIPSASYGGVLFMAAMAYKLLQTLIVRLHGQHSRLAKQLGPDFKGNVSPFLYAIAIGASFIRPWIGGCI